MKQEKNRLLLKIIVLIIGLGLWFYAAQDIYRALIRTRNINQQYVELYQPQLNIKIIKNAAGVLE